MKDRVMASLMACKATEVLQKGLGSRVIASKGNDVIDIDIEEALNMTKQIDEDMIATSKMLSL